MRGTSVGRMGAAAVFGAFLIVGCLESPMAFSPDGNDLLTVVVRPFDVDDLATRGACTYQLVRWRRGGPAEVIEQTDQAMLCGAGYSPDGQLCGYVRLPLSTEQEQHEFDATLKQRGEQIEAWDKDSVATAPPGTATVSVDKVADHAVPTQEQLLVALAGKLAPRRPRAHLVLRDAASMAELEVVEFPLGWSGAVAEGGVTSYASVRVQFDAAGRWVYVVLGGQLLGYDRQARTMVRLAEPVGAGVLGPDGRWAAVQAGDDAVSAVQLDGGQRVTWRTGLKLGLNGMQWLDARTLLLLGVGEHDEQETALLVWLDVRDGVKQTRPLAELDADDKAAPWLQLAAAPDGQRLVAATPDQALLLDGQGTVLKTLAVEHGDLVQPVFTPDGRRVALKRVVEDDDGEAVPGGVALFDRDGTLLETWSAPGAAGDRPEADVDAARD